MQTGTLSRAEVEERLTALAGEALVQRLQSSAWKERLEAMQELTELVLGHTEGLDASMLIQARAHAHLHGSFDLCTVGILPIRGESHRNGAQAGT